MGVNVAYLAGMDTAWENMETRKAAQRLFNERTWKTIKVCDGHSTKNNTWSRGSLW